MVDDTEMVETNGVTETEMPQINGFAHDVMETD